MVVGGRGLVMVIIYFRVFFVRNIGFWFSFVIILIMVVLDLDLEGN